MPTVPDVFDPARLGPATLRNRIVKAATFEGRTPEGAVTDDLVDFHVEVARGGVGMTTVAYCAVAPEGRTDRHQILMRPEAVAELRRLTDAVHAEGAAVAAQLGHAGPVANGASNRRPALAPHALPSPLSMRMMRRATETDLARIVAAHADAARVAVAAGFDAVELHFGHNYLISSFLSPALNHRSDGYGGSPERRARLARETAAAVREAVGGGIAVTAKLNMDDGVPGGLRPDDSLHVARRLEADGTLDALTLTAGSSLLNPMYLFTGDAPVKEFAGAFGQPLRTGLRLAGPAFLRRYPYRDAYLLDRALRFRDALELPLVLLGGITGRDTMDLAMRHGFAFVAMARALLREPDLPNRLRAEPRHRPLCVHCNKCMPSIYSRTRCVLDAPV
ncbi:2,4-dienoyl-CoA reductase-like NADH-dependent reductase (Old Yellow Enzyme family) [Prauserella isguenensis]|uniref:2,4-dienoyl-CoA reductase-like NADH-dependent reductase (Old Yellow Enzyme family) n=1 Tax=Prauserella isguenensis TaxID=1470180 RepID=A0A839S0Q0_9PSEU|nr:2,4-dienoyl-CoA reductase-like NADH-dependent reductase (Old Yellow Enzyme family) [Prauserella isguenensis]